jgi:HAD superfamily hydrolase (TIGR01490 family)
MQISYTMSDRKSVSSHILAVFDLDGTLTKGLSVEQFFMLYLLKTRKIGIRSLLSTVAYWARNVLIDPVEARQKNKRYLKGKRVGDVETWIDEFFIANDKIIFAQNVVDIAARHKQRLHKSILITGSPSILAAKLPLNDLFDHVYSTALEASLNVFTGKISGPHYYGLHKEHLVKQLAGELNASLERSFCYANSCDDIPMLSLFGNPVAVHPDKGLKKYARDHEWQLIE